MRVAAVILAVWSHAAHARLADGRETHGDITNIISCTTAIGPVKCIAAYGAWRAERATDTGVNDSNRFPWELYSQEPEEELYTKLSEGTEKLLRHRSLTMDLGPDYAVRLGSVNGSLNLDVVENPTEEGRGAMKKMRKYFYQLLPALLIPGLIMSAVLPFVLPAFKMMVVGAGMLNNMALMGAVFTLLRNNAFNDNHLNKVIYINDGYKNERLRPLADEINEHIVDPNYNGDVTHDIQDYHVISEDDGFAALDGYTAVNPDWIKKYNEVRGKYSSILGGKTKRKGLDLEV
ncbi:uncharacterized protein [Epargyreus clarus]|uniref:uncharacterized protein n=1 Tax=Epargyreus clarus TaxID=520877 RepID=UPI003C2C255A